MNTLSLVPLPRSIELRGAPCALREQVELAGAPSSPAVSSLVRSLEDVGCECASTSSPNEPAADDVTRIEFVLDPSVEGDERYVLVVDGDAEVRVRASTARGLDLGARTLAQLVRATEGDAPTLDGVVIDDAPSFPHRGVMLDVSRDRVPTMETLYRLVERFADWKLNELQLYVEHTFAYADHEEVWRDTGALTADEVRALDAFCAERHIALVPNQQCFGHMHRWLTHARYRDLAECPDGVEHPFSRVKEPFSLCATDPRALDFVDGLLDELLACFRSDVVNVGCDETFDLGEGRSKDACAERGVAAVYLDYLRALGECAERRGKRMQFWADIVLNHPESIADLPAGSIPMLWGYEAEHPFEEQTKRLAASGFPYYVCPGTSSWQSLAGRLDNMVRNVAASVRFGRANGAIGVLVTDWGDRGHLQPLPASHAGFVTTADLAWNADAPAERRTPDALAELLARHVYDEDPASAPLAHATIELARASERVGAKLANASPLSVALTKIDAPFPPPELTGLTEDALERLASSLARARDLVRASAEADVESGALADDAPTVRRELDWTARLMDVARRIALTRLRGDAPSSADVRGELDACIDEYRELWLARSRPGGFERSADWLHRVRAALDA